MVFKIGYLVSFLSRFMRLMPGDIVTTGTPPGVGMGCKPPEFLKPGDVMSRDLCECCVYELPSDARFLGGLAHVAQGVARCVRFRDLCLGRKPRRGFDTLCGLGLQLGSSLP